jgi:ferritin
MLTSQKVIDAINEQIGYEFSAELQYYAIAAHFAAEALPQLSQHFFKQAEEEKGHALRFIKYVVDAGGRVVIPALEAPKSNFKTPKDAVKLSLDQEVHVTQQINGLVGLALSENDYITINFLQWFLTEQLEEVSSMDNLLKIVERISGASRHQDDAGPAEGVTPRVGRYCRCLVSLTLALSGVPVVVFNNSYNSGVAAQKVLRRENS